MVYTKIISLFSFSLVIGFLLLPTNPAIGQAFFSGEDGVVLFKSEAPLELIEASSDQLKGVIDPAERTFAFSIRINTLEGFNNTLQKIHFNENYMESKKYPTASFAGRIIEDISFDQDGIYTVRAKGKLLIHGVEQERIIKGQLTIKEQQIGIDTNFIIPLEEHNISIPKLVFNKIAEEIQVSIKIQLTRTIE